MSEVKAVITLLSLTMDTQLMISAVPIQVMLSFLFMAVLYRCASGLNRSVFLQRQAFGFFVTTSTEEVNQTDLIPNIIGHFLLAS